VRALQRIDVTSVLFFLGILLAIGALESVGILHQLALLMNEKVGNLSIIVMGTGVASAIVDNVPLVAAAMKMYDLQTYPPDSYIWEFLAYCAGTGGSILIIRSSSYGNGANQLWVVSAQDCGVCHGRIFRRSHVIYDDGRVELGQKKVPVRIQQRPSLPYF
jgi:Na+/H+ antiporter NhaD/arsenite permease-like protein